MKKLLVAILAVMFMAGTAISADLSFMWDANTEPDLAGYRIFMHTEGGTYDYTNPVIECTGVGASVTGLLQGETYYFVLRAFDTEGLESGNSNEIFQYIAQDWEGVAPNPPGNLRFVN